MAPLGADFAGCGQEKLERCGGENDRAHIAAIGNERRLSSEMALIIQQGGAHFRISGDFRGGIAAAFAAQFVADGFTV